MITQMSKAATGVAFLQAAVFAARWMFDEDLSTALLTAAFSGLFVAFLAASTSFCMSFTGYPLRYYGITDAGLVAGLVVAMIASFTELGAEAYFSSWFAIGIAAATYFIVIEYARTNRGAEEPWWVLALAISPLSVGTFFGIGHYFFAYGNGESEATEKTKTT